MSTGFQRMSTAQNALFGVYEVIVNNETIKVNNNTDPIMEYYLDNGLDSEKDYMMNLIKLKPEYLTPVASYLETIETEKMCEMIYPKSNPLKSTKVSVMEQGEISFSNFNPN